LIAHPSVIGASCPCRSNVDDSIGSPSSVSRARTTAWSGIRMPTVRFLGWYRRRGTSLVAGGMKVYGPGVAAFTARKAALSSFTSWPSCPKSAQTNVM
jgi:hypothetical protein